MENKRVLLAKVAKDKLNDNNRIFVVDSKVYFIDRSFSSDLDLVLKNEDIKEIPIIVTNDMGNVGYCRLTIEGVLIKDYLEVLFNKLSEMSDKKDIINFLEIKEIEDLYNGYIESIKEEIVFPLYLHNKSNSIFIRKLDSVLVSIDDVKIENKIKMLKYLYNRFL